MRLQPSSLGRSEHYSEEDGRDGYDMRGVEEGKVGGVAVVHYRVGESGFFGRQTQRSLQFSQGTVSVVQDHATLHRGDELELALPDFTRFRDSQLWPLPGGFCEHEADVLGRFFHFAREVGGCDHDEVRVCALDWGGEVEARDVDLGCGEGLLAEGHAFGEFEELGLGVDGQVAGVGEGFVGWV